METLSALGAGVAVSAADLDLRGAGDLFGEQQAGHLRAAGTELYQHLLTQAVARQRSDASPPSAAELHVELAGRIPESYVPEENLRIGLLPRCPTCRPCGSSRTSWRTASAHHRRKPRV